jgi:hypothetical protein
MGRQLASERVIVESPMSVTGAVRRSMRLAHADLGLTAPWAIAVGRVVLWCAAVSLAVAWGLLAAAWSLVMLVLFWWLFIVWRLFRRGNRNRKAEQLRHRELMAALEQRQPAAPAPRFDVYTGEPIGPRVSPPAPRGAGELEERRG